MPLADTGSDASRAPEARAGASTESCSIAETQISSQPAAITQLLASVAPLVNTTSLGLAFTSCATSSRARSTIARTARPSACTDEGFPVVSIDATIAARASARSGADAL